jgi:hypothetical protein
MTVARNIGRSQRFKEPAIELSRAPWSFSSPPATRALLAHDRTWAMKLLMLHAGTQMRAKT